MWNIITSYEERTRVLDTIIDNIISSIYGYGYGYTNDLKTTYKFYLLCLLHNLVIFPIYLIFFFTKNVYLFLACFWMILIQIALNIIDNGCFFLKLERKYIGKWWYGGYTLLGYINPDLLNGDFIGKLYYFIMGLIVVFGVYRAHQFNIL
jgi:hypothetical protein